MSGGSRARAGAALVILFLTSLAAVATRPHTADEIEYYAFLRSAWFDRDLSFDNEYRYFYDQGFIRDPLFKATFIDRRTPTGHAVTYAPIGTALLWLPFFAVADAGVRVAQLAGSSVARDGFSAPYLSATAYASTIYGALALAMGALMARRVIGLPGGPLEGRFGGRFGVTAAAAVFAGTPIVFYMYVMPHMSHACSAFAVALFVWTWLDVRRSWTVRGVAALTLAGALMAMVREQDAFVVIVPALDYLWAIGRRSGTDGPAPTFGDAIVRGVVAVMVFAAGVLPQVVAYVTINGRIGPSPDVSNKMYWSAPWAWLVVFSPEHGWFFWTPLAAIAVLGLVWLAFADPVAGTRRIGLLLALAVLTQVYVSGSVLSWTLAGAFGQRRFVGLTAILVVGLAWILARTYDRFRWMVMPALVLAVWWNLGLAVQFGENSMDCQRLDLRRTARVTYTELPRRLPRVVARYLFDRASFYRSRP